MKERIDVDVIFNGQPATSNIRFSMRNEYINYGRQVYREVLRSPTSRKL